MENKAKSAHPAGRDATSAPARNAVRPSTSRKKGRLETAADKEALTQGQRPRPVPADNAIRPTQSRMAGRPAAVALEIPAAPPSAAAPDAARPVPPPPSPSTRPESPTSAQSDAPDVSTIPADIHQRFVKVGRKYYFPDGARAFTDRGKRLTTQSENTEVIRSLIGIAQARGWSDVTITGSERFRREAWFAARLAGLSARGYKPTEFEQERLVRATARRNGADMDNPAPPQRAQAVGDQPASGKDEPGGRDHRQGRGALTAGRLIDHGRATYLHNPHEQMSYFVKIETERGERTLWGVDLERAFKESLTRPQLGDAIGVRATRQDTVTVKAPERDADGLVVGEKSLQTHRNRWIIEKREFFESRAAAAQKVRDGSVAAREAVKVHPELAGTYLYLRGAEEIAQRRIRDPEDQRKFVAIVRSALAQSVAHGEPLPPVRLRAKRNAEREPRSPSRSRGSAPRDPAPARI